MVVTQQHVFTVRREAEWVAINSAVRLEMLVFIQTIGPCSIRELARLMDCPPDGLYHHMRKLVSAGLALEVGSRKVGTQTEAVYRAVARDITIDRNLARKTTRQRITRFFRTILQHAQRTMETALQSRAASLEGDTQTVGLKWGVAWLDEKQLARVRQHQQAINEILQERVGERNGRLFAVLTYLAPVIRSRRFQLPSPSLSNS